MVSCRVSLKSTHTRLIPLAAGMQDKNLVKSLRYDSQFYKTEGPSGAGLDADGVLVEFLVEAMPDKSEYKTM